MLRRARHAAVMGVTRIEPERLPQDKNHQASVVAGLVPAVGTGAAAAGRATGRRMGPDVPWPPNVA